MEVRNKLMKTSQESNKLAKDIRDLYMDALYEGDYRLARGIVKQGSKILNVLIIQYDLKHSNLGKYLIFGGVPKVPIKQELLDSYLDLISRTNVLRDKLIQEFKTYDSDVKKGLYDKPISDINRDFKLVINSLFDLYPVDELDIKAFAVNNNSDPKRSIESNQRWIKIISNRLTI